MMALHCNIIISMILSADNFTLNKVDQGDSENKLNYVRYLNEMSYKNKEHEKVLFNFYIFTFYKNLQTNIDYCAWRI